MSEDRLGFFLSLVSWETENIDMFLRETETSCQMVIPIPMFLFFCWQKVVMRVIKWHHSLLYEYYSANLEEKWKKLQNSCISYTVVNVSVAWVLITIPSCAGPLYHLLQMQGTYDSLLNWGWHYYLFALLAIAEYGGCCSHMNACIGPRANKFGNYKMPTCRLSQTRTQCSFQASQLFYRVQ